MGAPAGAACCLASCWKEAQLPPPEQVVPHCPWGYLTGQACEKHLSSQLLSLASALLPLVTSLSQLFLKSTVHLESLAQICLVPHLLSPHPWKYLVTVPVIEPSALLPNLSKSHTQSPFPVLRNAARPTSPNAGGHYVSKETNVFSFRISQSRTLLQTQNVPFWEPAVRMVALPV